MKNFGKYLLLILAFFSIGEASACSHTSAEIKEELPLSSENLQAVNFSLFPLRLNSFQEIPDLSKNQYFAIHSVLPTALSVDTMLSIEIQLNFERDLRKIISEQIFPEHFFL